MQFIQEKLHEKIDCIKVLGSYIKATKNGWSPLSVEYGEGTPILGQEHFAFDGTLKIEPSKFTEETRNNIKDFYIKQGDFFVSRGNTVDLVALASIVKDEINNDILFPDLYIKVEFDETEINKEYVAYLFNSFFGRLYFKYVAKGKNQTMVKISSVELLNFRFPLPNKDLQTKIVEKIKTQIDKQNIFDSQIEFKQQEISKIIADAIQAA
jgi:type I restriction enzyme, S subunit